MTPGTAANLIMAGLIAVASMQFSRVVGQIDTLAEKLQAHDVRLAVLETRQQP